MDLKQGDKHIFGMAKVGEKGQIVIPKAARELFGIKPGDSVVVVGNEQSGLAIITSEALITFFTGIMAQGAAQQQKEEDEE